MRFFSKISRLLFVMVLMAHPLVANECSLIVSDCESGELLMSTGDCMRRESPCSTFKLALSLMGFDAGILINAHEPEFGYKKEYNAMREVCRHAQTPTTWIQNSCIWYSQEIVEKLGREKFGNYVENFAYGNQDVSGASGNSNGFAECWLCSSLKISPHEQIEFINKLLKGTLPIGSRVIQQMLSLFFLAELSDDWCLYGKQGAGIDGAHNIGWFVGWVVNCRTSKTFSFACLLTSNNPESSDGGCHAKELALEILYKDVIHGTGPL